MVLLMATLIRIMNRILSWLAALILLLIVALAVTLYLAICAKNITLLRAMTSQVGRVMAGQRIEQLTLDVRVLPDQGQLSGTAALTVRSLEEGRQHFYFLLNDRLHVRDVRVSSADGGERPASAYQLWLLTVVALDAPVPKDATVQLTVDYAGRPTDASFGNASMLFDPRQVLLNVDAFWYPTDVQGFFSADVTVTAPANLTIVQNAVSATRSQRGDVQQVRWHTDRPVAGLALVAGEYELSTTESDGLTYRQYLPRDVHLDAKRVLTSMSDANRTFQDRYGPSEFRQVTAFVSRRLRRAFNDGSGVLGISVRYFRMGDYGFGILAHEIAHNWWGDRVAEKWLSPGTGGEWIVEGLAEYSSLVATAAEYGPDALPQRLADEFFDPARQRTIAQMSVLDNALTEATARDTIYRKGAYTAMMLQRILGEDVFSRALRQFVEQFRYQQVTDSDLQKVLQEVSGQDLEPYFADWIRSDRLADLSLEGNDRGELTVSNLGPATIPGDIDLWTFKKGGGAPARSTVRVGDHVTLEPDAAYAILDPLLAWADVQRENNRYPRQSDPVYVAASATGEIATTSGEIFPWVRCSISTTAGGRTQHTWDFDRGPTAPPVWSPDGARLVVNVSDPARALPAVVTLAREGERHTLGHGSMPWPAADGIVYAAADDRIVRFAADGKESTVLRRPGESLDQPQASPDGTQLAYTAARANRLELRTVKRDGNDDRLVLAWDRDRIVYRWAPDGTRLYAVIGGNWDWQVWEIPLPSGEVRVLASGAAAIADLAVSPAGQQLAFTAAPALDYPNTRRQLYVLNVSDRSVRTIDVPDADLSRLAWAGPDSLLVISTALPPGAPRILPAQHTLKRVRPSDGGVEDGS